MAKFKYHIGDTFNNWTLLSYTGNGKWRARCKCGIEKDVFIDHLVTGNSKGCNKCSGAIRATHYMTGTPEYRSWSKMNSRCNNPNDGRYHQYCGRGIIVCERWELFENFYSDMGARPIGCSLDRIDVDGNYEPSNCRWATPKQQMRNRRIHKTSQLGKSVTEVAEQSGLPYGTLQTRLKRGWNVERALSEPLHDKQDSLSAKARAAGLSAGTVLCRVNRGWGLERALSEPIHSKDSKCG